MEKNTSQHVSYYEVHGYVFIFVLAVFLKPNYTEVSIFCSSSVGLTMEQYLGERKPHQGETNKSESSEAAHTVGHFRETVFPILYGTRSVTLVVSLIMI